MEAGKYWRWDCSPSPGALYNRRATLLVRQSGASFAILMRTGQLTAQLWVLNLVFRNWPISTFCLLTFIYINWCKSNSVIRTEKPILLFYTKALLLPLDVTNYFWRIFPSGQFFHQQCRLSIQVLYIYVTLLPTHQWISTYFLRIIHSFLFLLLYFDLDLKKNVVLVYFLEKLLRMSIIENLPFEINFFNWKCYNKKLYLYTPYKNF